MMRKKSVFLILILFPLLTMFYVGEFVTGSFHFIVKCDPPKKLLCKGVDFADAEFMGVDFHRGHFQNAILSNSHLHNANLYHADLTHADLTHADLTGANLSGATLVGANLTGANLSGANLDGANLNFAKIENADLTNVTLNDASLESTDLTSSKLTQKGLLGAKLLNTKMPDGVIKTNQFPNSANYNQNLPTATVGVAKVNAVSISCRDGMVLAYCQVYWSDGRYRPLPYGVGQRTGGIVDAIIYYDLQWNPSCILLYADGSIMTSYDTGQC